MKEEIWGWVQEFVLLEDLPEALFLCRLLQILPHSSSSPRLKKTLILRQLLSDLPQLSPETLRSLQLLQQFDPNPNPNPDLLRSAYLHVAVGATFSSPNFRDAVEEIWARRGGDLSEELADWKRRMEAAASKEEAMEGWDAQRAVDAVREYARAELDAMGPPLLVRLAEYLKAEREAVGTATVAGRVKKRKAGCSSVFRHILTPEVQKVRDALIRSSKALQNVVEDLLTSAKEVVDSPIPHNSGMEAGIHVEEPRESPCPSEDNYNMVDKSPQAHPVDDAAPVDNAAADIHTEKRTKPPNDATKATLNHNMVNRSPQAHPVDDAAPADDAADDIHTEKRTKPPNDATKATLNHNMVDRSPQAHPVDDDGPVDGAAPVDDAPDDIHTEKRTKPPNDATKATLNHNMVDKSPQAHPVDDAAPVDDIHTEKRTKPPNDATKATLSYNMVDKSPQAHPLDGAAPVDDAADDIHTEKRTKPPIDATKATLNHNMVDKSAQVHPVDNIHTEKRTKRPNDATKATLMDRNPTARTYEWEDDSIGSSKEGTARSKKLHLRTPRTKPPSLAKDVEINNTFKSAKGRKRRRWIPVEEDDLRKAVEKYVLVCPF